jgi:hypothetical protein
MLFTNQGDHLRGVPGIAKYEVFHNEAADDHTNFMAGIDYSLLSNPRLFITCAALAADNTLDLYTFGHNMVKFEKEGKQVKISQLYRN